MKDEWWKMNVERWMLKDEGLRLKGVLRTDERTDICDCRVAFATENPLLYSIVFYLDHSDQWNKIYFQKSTIIPHYPFTQNEPLAFSSLLYKERKYISSFVTNKLPVSFFNFDDDEKDFKLSNHYIQNTENAWKFV